MDGSTRWNASSALSAVRGRVGEWADGLEQLDDRARPAVRHDQRQRVLVCRLHVDEVDVQPVDLGLELRQRVQSRLAPAPVVFGRPVAGELLRRRQLHTLRPIGDEFLGRPASRIDAAAQFFDLALRNFDSERADPGLRARGRGVTHDRVLPVASLGVLSIAECRGRRRDILGERDRRPDGARSGARFTRAVESPQSASIDNAGGRAPARAVERTGSPTHRNSNRRKPAAHPRNSIGSCAGRPVRERRVDRAIAEQESPRPPRPVA